MNVFNLDECPDPYQPNLSPVVETKTYYDPLGGEVDYTRHKDGTLTIIAIRPMPLVSRYR